ncbi:MAG: hypothetical protein ACJ786_16295 [Catenulispora sp.]|jgi:hypothetical protein
MRISKKVKVAIVGAAAAGVMAVSATDAFADSYIPGSDVYSCQGNAWLEASSSNWAYAYGYGGCTIGVLQQNTSTGGWKIFPANTNEYFGDGVHTLQACFVLSDYSRAIACGPQIWHS